MKALLLLQATLVGCVDSPAPVPASVSQPDALHSSTDHGTSHENIDLKPTQTTELALPDSSLQTDSEQLRMEAKRCVDELVQRLPKNPDALELKARMHLLLGENKTAKQTWEQALMLAPNYAYAFQGLGEIAIQNGEYEIAADFFKKAIPGQPDNPQPSQDLAGAYVKLGQVDKAISILTESAKVHPNAMKTFLLLGQSYLTNRKFEEAKSAFEVALQLSTDFPLAQQGLGTALLRLGQREEAQKLLQSQQSQRAISTRSRSQSDGAMNEKKDVSKRFGNVAKLYLESGLKEKAEEILRRSMALDPQNLNSAMLLLGLLQSPDRQQDAMKLAAQMCEIAPNDPSCHFTHGTLLARNGVMLTAEREFEEVLKLAPTSPIGFDAIVRLWVSNRRKLDQALKYAHTLVELRGNAADCELLGQVYAVKGDLQKAKTHLQKAIDLDPENKNYRIAMQHLDKALGLSNE
ncbi:MAG TPA: tetratricopeptide repeat protein [Pirellula sp.]|nr:tetratricopeptide repeat protein [Pirellula sp.]